MFAEMATNFFQHFANRVLGNHWFSRKEKHSELKYTLNEMECLIQDVEISFTVNTVMLYLFGCVRKSAVFYK